MIIAGRFDGLRPVARCVCAVRAAAVSPPDLLVIGRFSPHLGQRNDKRCLLQAEIAMTLETQPCQAPDKSHFCFALVMF